MSDQDVCSCCGEPLRSVCPTCLRLVLVQNGKLASHQTSTCQGSHMTYGSCAGSNQPPKKLDK